MTKDQLFILLLVIVSSLVTLAYVYVLFHKVSKIKISYANRMLKIEGVTPEDIITVSSIQGVNHEINPIYNSETAIATLNNLAKGIYIIRIKEQTLKFTIK